MEPFALGMPWDPARPHVLVVACSDGRLQEATDAFLDRVLGIRRCGRSRTPTCTTCWCAGPSSRATRAGPAAAGAS